MKLTHLELTNFRNYAQLTLDPHPQLNIFTGANAQGKTNILESIYFLALTRSHRTHHDRELIRWEADEARVSGLVKRANSTLPLELRLDAKGRSAFINRLKEPRLADYIGQMNTILFAPEDLQLVKGAPSVRRRFLDMEIGQIRPVYLYDSLRYNRALRERNAYVRYERAKIDPQLLDVLDAQLVSHGERLMTARRDFVAQLTAYAAPIHQQLTQGQETLTLSYQQNVTEDFLSSLISRRERDIARHQTSTGPHRDDLTFQVNGINIADYGSQGQQRTTALAIKLAEIDLIHHATGDYPILLLDDVMSELDNARQLDLLATSLDKTQTFLTTTTLEHLSQLPEQLSIYDVAKGNIKTVQ